MKKEKNRINGGDVFLAHNENMEPPKNKFHLCINKNNYFIINTKPHAFNCEITPEDCSLLSHKSHIDCSRVMTEPIKNFNIIKKEELSTSAILRLIERVKVCPVLMKIHSSLVIEELSKCLKDRGIL